MQQPSPAARLFDAIAEEYESAFAASEGRRQSVAWLLGELPPGSRVLDIGSGTGRPVAAALAGSGHRVTGLDVSPVMVELASRHVPDARFLLADIRTHEPEPGHYDGVCSYFSLLQMTRAEQRAVLVRAAAALVPGGVCALATVPLDLDGAEGRWMGHEVTLSSFSTEAFVHLVEEAGLSVAEVREEEFTPATALASPEPQLYVHCRRPL
ncbi:class I SAM-dependent DNA methyltransferase [Streptomyces sp. NPDC047999]|uniref:class I SAM-dependent DNA methyltransferase n=1 Tax=Streptomyces sp. NPDC047999 TaxID=3365497 RepID=UPI003710C85A